MEIFGPPIALTVASLATILELVTSKFPRTGFLLRRSLKLYLYALIYGVLAATVMACLSHLVAKGTISLEGSGLSQTWIQALAIGLSTKALLHIRIFNVAVGGRDFPIGVETLVQLFEPWLLREIELDHFNRKRLFLAPLVTAYTDLSSVRKRIRGDVPTSLPAPERSAFLHDVETAESVESVFELYLDFLGRDSLRRLFPVPSPP
jgi:hypothetical protein